MKPGLKGAGSRKAPFSLATSADLPHTRGELQVVDLPQQHVRRDIDVRVEGVLRQRMPRVQEAATRGTAQAQTTPAGTMC